MGKKKTTFNISKSENFSEWYSEILNKAEIVDLRYGVKGFVVIRPWGARIIDKMYKIYESALRCTGHEAAIFPAVIPEKNFKRESSHVDGFAPEVFWLDKKQGDEKLALRPTSETAFYEMYNLWIRSYRDLPMKIYQRANVFRNETKATRPLIRSREFHWIESHDAFATKKDAEAQVQDDIVMTEEVMHKIFGVPFLPMKRPQWDKFPGAEYTIGSDSILPDGKVIQQPSTHLISQHFVKAFDVKFVDEREKEKTPWLTCYGPCMSRILASVISVHGDDNGLVLPYTISPVQVVVVPFYSEESKKVREMVEKIQKDLLGEHIDVRVDNSGKRPGEKFFHWEMKGVPFRIEIGEKELESGEVIVFIRDTREKISVRIDDLAESIKNLGAEYDSRLLARADDSFKSKIVDCKDKVSIKKALKLGKIVKFSFCSVENDGAKCAEFVEKELEARVMGIRADIEEKASGKCVICGEKSNVIIYAGKSY
ncbi:proline--tRNA ligase [Candidatus Pacearchaeota archaeon]|nr:proline--tRNA ligase [Candidatus Pacearchaeota archaeon]